MSGVFENTLNIQSSLAAADYLRTVTSGGNSQRITMDNLAGTLTGRYLASVAVSGSYYDLDDTPTFAAVATTGVYSDLSGTPTLATVATTGDYDDLLNLPTIPTVDSALDSTSTNPVENQAIYTALSGKQDTLTAGSNITIAGNVISATASGGSGLEHLADGSTTGSLIGSGANSTQTLGNYAVSLGYGSKATGHSAFASGYQTNATGNYSFAVGYGTYATATDSHAEGYNARATGSDSHAEGHNSRASGIAAHAEGSGYATGDYSHAEGGGTTASGDYSHAGGMLTTASGDCQTVIGKYNATGTSYAFIIGGGTSNSNKLNIFTVSWAGNVIAAGTLEAGDAILGDIYAGDIYSTGELSSDGNTLVRGDLKAYGDVLIALPDYQTSGTTDYEIYTALVSLGWDSDVIV